MRSLCLLRILLLVLAAMPTNAQMTLATLWKSLGDLVSGNVADASASSVEAAFECPTMEPETFCTEEYEPVICNETCTYSNSCFAKMSGYDVDANCKSGRNATRTLLRTGTVHW
jgi:hypothetical protein